MVFPPPLTFLSTGRHYPAKERTKAQEENVGKALLVLLWGISSQGQKHENMKFHSKVSRPPHFANFLTPEPGQGAVYIPRARDLWHWPSCASRLSGPGGFALSWSFLPRAF